MAPETWITAAPQDTVTTRDSQGQPVAPVEGRIPIRFHLYWAGSDKDGAVVGFYWAVTETTATSAGDGLPIPGLPAPKASDYHFTTRTDSTFVFDVSPDAAEREHEFFIYAVDDKGKADPTPAKFVFRAYDRYPPTPVFTRSEAVGVIYSLQPGGGVAPVTRTYPVHDIFYFGHNIPTDTVPTGSLLHFAWKGIAALGNNPVTGYRYKLTEPQFNVVDSSVHSVTYNTGVGTDVVAPGVLKFTLQAMDQSGGHGDSTRYFQMNFSPDEWFSGPDTLNAFWNTYSDGNGKHYYYRDITTQPFVTWAGFKAAGGVLGSMLSADSANVMPASRPVRKTFFEIYGDRIWAHGEGDTVSLNSWVIVPSGGYDKDSPYAVKVGIDPDMPASGAVITPGPPNGSPIGFRQLASTKLFDGGLLSPSETTTYPVFDVASVYWAPRINAYCEMKTTGKAYFYADAEDGDGAVDRRLENNGGAVRIADAVDRDTIGTGVPPAPATDVQAKLRTRVLTFFVNHAPYLLTSDGTFFPTPPRSGVAFTPSSLHAGTLVTLKLPADDADPIDYALPMVNTGGPQPSNPKVLVRKAQLRGTTTGGLDSTITLADQVELSDVPVVIPAYFAAGAAHVLITLCDFRDVDAENRHWGRCAPVLDIPVTITTGAPAEAATGASQVLPQTTQRPGSPQADGRRQLP